jgi:Zn-dependent metalloprotease
MTASDKTSALNRKKAKSRKPQPQSADPVDAQMAASGFLSGPLDGAPEQAASRFLDANYSLVTQQRSELHELQLKQVARSPAGYHVTFQQVHQGLPVEGAVVSVHMTKDQRVNATTGRLSPEVAGLDLTSTPQTSMRQEEAVQIALRSLQTTGGPVTAAQVHQVILAKPDPRLAWKVSVFAMQSAREWLIWVDAKSGQVLQSREISLD